MTGVQHGLSRSSGRSIVFLAIVYLLVAAAFTITSRVLDTRQKFPTGLTRTLYESGPNGDVERGQVVTPDITLDFLDDDPALPRRNFTVRWNGVWLRPQAQPVEVFAGADDEVVVKVDDRVVIDRNAPLGRGDMTARFLLPEGSHQLEVVYRQRGGDYYLYFGVAEAGGVPGAIDAESLFPRRPPARRLRANRNLWMLRRAAVGAWIVPPLLALLWVGLPRGARGVRRAWHSWLGRIRDGWRPEEGGTELPHPAGAPPNRAIAALYVVSALVFLGAVWQFREPQYGFTRFIAFGEQFQENVLPALRQIPHHVHEHSGYDGQFYAQLALEPTLRNQDLSLALDSFPTRARRILFSWTAYVLGLGRPSWIIQAYAVQNVGFWLLLGFLLLRWLPPVDMRHWLAWCACLFGPGAIASVTYALTDLPSTALMAAGLAASESGYVLTAGAAIGLSVLGRETALLGAVGINWWRSLKEAGLARTVVAAALVVAPVLLWLLYMQSIMGPRVWPTEGGNLSAPFEGMIAHVQRGIRELRLNGWEHSSEVLSGLKGVAALLVQAGYLLWRAEWHRAWWRAGFAFAALMAGLTLAVFEGNPGAAVRVLLPMTIAFNVLLPKSPWFWPLFVLGNASLLDSLAVLRLWPLW